jgi:hypothetical protein
MWVQEELEAVVPGKAVNREPARPRTDFTEVWGQKVELPDVSLGTTETLKLQEQPGGGGWISLSIVGMFGQLRAGTETLCSSGARRKHLPSAAANFSDFC